MTKFFLNYFNSLREISRSARIYLIGAMCLGFAQGSFWALENIYFKQIGLPHDVIGSIRSLRMLPTVLIAIPIAKILMLFRVKHVLMVGSVLAGISYYGLVSFENPQIIRMFSFLLGISNGMIMLSGPIFIMRNSSATERVHLFGLGFAVRMGAGALGALTCGWLMRLLAANMNNQVLADRYVLMSVAGVALLAIIPFFLIREEGKPDLKAEEKKLWPVREPIVTIKLCIPEMLVGLGAGSFIPYINLYFNQVFGQKEGAIGTIFAMLQCVNFFAFLIAPIVAKKIGLLRTIVLTQFMSFPFLFVMGFTPKGLFFVVVIAFLLRGGLMNMAQPMASNFALELVPRYDQPLTNSLRRLAWTGGFALSSYFGGMLIEYRKNTIGPDDAFTWNILWCILMYISSAGLNYLFFRKTPRDIGIVETKKQDD